MLFAWKIQEKSLTDPLCTPLSQWFVICTATLF